MKLIVWLLARITRGDSWQFLIHSNFVCLRTLTSNYSNFWRTIYHYCYTNLSVKWFIRSMVWFPVQEKRIGTCNNCAYVSRFLYPRFIYADSLLSNLVR